MEFIHLKHFSRISSTLSQNMNKLEYLLPPHTYPLLMLHPVSHAVVKNYLQGCFVYVELRLCAQAASVSMKQQTDSISDRVRKSPRLHADLSVR